MIASKPRFLIKRHVSLAASRYFYLSAFKSGVYFSIESDLGICIMIEIFNKTFNKSDKTLETTKNNLKDRVTFLLGYCSSNRGGLLDKLDYRDDETTERD